MNTLRGLTAVLLLALLCATSASAVQFSMTDLGGISAADINDAGTIAGIDAQGVAVWNSRTLQRTQVWTDTNARDLHINSLNRISGVVGTTVYLWSTIPDQYVEYSLSGYQQSAGVGHLDDQNRMAGSIYYDQTNGVTYNRAVVWPNNGLTYFLNHLTGMRTSVAVGFDSSGRPVGNSGSRAVVWNSTTAQAMPLDPAWTSSSLSKASDNGRYFIGTVSDASVQNWAIWKDGVMKTFVLPGLPTTSTYKIAGVSNSGTVLGYLQDALGGDAISAFIWTETGGYVDINSLIPANNGWTVKSALALNNQNQILVRAQNGATSHDFLLNPIVPEPSSFLALGSGLIALGGLLRRRR